MSARKSKRTVKAESDDEDVKKEEDVKAEEDVKHEVDNSQQEDVNEVPKEEDYPAEQAEQEEVQPEEPPTKRRKVGGNADPDYEEAESLVNENGEHYVELSNKRRATVREFKGSTLIDLREYYTDKSGDEKPGSKGLSLTTEQWQTLKAAMPQIDAWVAAMPGTKKSESSGSKSARGKGRSKGNA